MQAAASIMDSHTGVRPQGKLKEPGCSVIKERISILPVSTATSDAKRVGDVACHPMNPFLRAPRGNQLASKGSGAFSYSRQVTVIPSISASLSYAETTRGTKMRLSSQFPLPKPFPEYAREYSRCSILHASLASINVSLRAI